MKKTFYHIGMLAVAALAFAGCAKEVDTRNEVRTHTVTFIAQSEETKTAIVEGQSSATYKWTTGDEQYLHITENGVAAESVSLALSSGNTVATITATFTTPPTTPNEYVYEAIYAKEVSKSNGNPLIQTTQEPVSDSFDPSADIMIAEAVTSTTAVSPLSFCFRRVVSVNKMTLKGLVAGEKVSSVEISADKSLGGYYLVSGDGFQYSGTKLTLNYSNAEVGSDGQFPVYFVCAPQSEVKIGVRVVTDQNVYERNDFTKTVDFKVGLVKRFGVQLGTYGTPVQTGTPYSLVSSQTELVDGATYIIVGNNTTLVAMAGQNNNNRAKVDVTAENNVITIDNTIAAATFTIESVTDGYTIKDNESGLYLYAAGASSNNYLRSTDDPKATATWSITIDSGIASIVTDGASRGTMCYNSTNSIFSCYSALGSYKTLSLYIDASALIPTLATPTIVAGAAGKTITVIWEDVANADSYLVTCTGQTDKTVNPGVEQADFVVQADGTYTVTVTAVSNDHTAYLDSAPASETVTVGNPALGKPVISAFTQTATGFSATLSAAVANATSYDWNLYEGYVDDGNEVGDGSFDATSLTINVPFSDTGLTYFEPDETYLLVVTAKAAGYTSTASDPASFVATAMFSPVGSGTATNPYTAGDIIGLYTGTTNGSGDELVYVTGTISEITEVSTQHGNATYTISDGTKSVLVYRGKFVGDTSFTSADQISENDVVVVYGKIGIYKDVPQLSQGNYLISVNGKSKVLTAGTLDATANDANKQITVTWGAASGTTEAISYVVNCGTQSYNATAAGSHVFTMSDYGSYEVSVVASASDAFSATVSTTVLLSAPGGNDGSADKPYSASEARALALSGDTGSYYIYGKVTKVQNQYSASYGTANFWIDENGTDQTVFEGYKIKYFGNVNWVNSNAEIAVGDDVIIYGTLTVYNTTTPETSSGYLVSLNGKTKGLTLAAPTVATDDSAKKITVTWAAATGSTSAISYVVTCGSQTYNATAAGSHTFTMSAYGHYDISVAASASDAIPATAIASATLSDPSSTTKDYYKMVTSVSDITAGTYVIGALRSQTATNNFYFAKASVSSGDWVVSDGAVTVAESNGVRKFEVGDLPAGAAEFTLTGDNTNGFTISNGSNYLYFTENSNRKLAFAASGSSQKWTFGQHTSPLITGGVFISAVGATYVITENSTASGAIRGYVSGTKYRAIYIFKKVNE